MRIKIHNFRVTPQHGGAKERLNVANLHVFACRQVQLPLPRIQSRKMQKFKIIFDHLANYLRRLFTKKDFKVLVLMLGIAVDRGTFRVFNQAILSQ